MTLSNTDRAPLNATYQANDGFWPAALVRHLAPDRSFPHRSNNQTPIHNQGVCHGNHREARIVEQGQTGRPEAAPQTEGHLGHPDTSAKQGWDS